MKADKLGQLDGICRAYARHQDGAELAIEEFIDAYQRFCELHAQPALEARDVTNLLCSVTEINIRMCSNCCVLMDRALGSA